MQLAILPDVSFILIVSSRWEVAGALASFAPQTPVVVAEMAVAVSGSRAMPSLRDHMRSRKALVEVMPMARPRDRSHR
ncbi:hypothetical protein KC327_g7 [Hortaea werneckii]|nr:hypothetical protein KC327_g7 [Hortaea werneckii]